MDVPILKTPRLVLAQLKANDLSRLVEIGNDFDIAKNLARMPHPFGMDDAIFFFENVVLKERVWAITNSQTKYLLGVIGLHPGSQEDAQVLGYWLGRAYWGKGYATEASVAVVDYAFKDLGVNELQSGYFASNAASGRVLEKLGFQAVDTTLKYGVAAAQEIPHVNVVLSRSHWRTMRELE